ncbi:MAG: peptidyl-prolyl cis-trans isomerase [Phycisphaerales bacterium]|nr:peptidyl-prolyl cis-trans isomerase [Phycisphaerales bacterium]
MNQTAIDRPRSAFAPFTALAVALVASLGSVAVAQEPAPSSPATPPPVAAPAAPATPVYAAMTTNKGVIVLELNPAKAPLSVENFVQYAKDGFYSGTVFHRVMKGFMIQGGGFTADLKQKSTRPPIKNEWKNGLPNSRGTLAMARTQVADSATSQFFINTVDNKMLDQPRDGAAYAVFGKVIKGMEVVDAIAATPTGMSAGMGDVPKASVVIEKVEILPGPPKADEPSAAPTAGEPTPTPPPTGSKGQ